MKLSVSLPDDDVAFIDGYAQQQSIPTRSAVVVKAIRLLRAMELGPDYERAWDEWTAADDAELWETAVADGIG